MMPYDTHTEHTPHTHHEEHDAEHACECGHEEEQHEAADEHGDMNHDNSSHASNTDHHARCNERIQQLEEQLAYLSSDFTNYRRNIEKEKTRWKQEAQASILQDLLSIMDDADRAVADLESQELSEDEEKRLEGIRLIHKSLRKLLDSYEVHEITHVHEFDPQWHEAIMQVSETDVPSGNIVSVIQKGYTHKGELLRTAKVSVAA